VQASLAAAGIGLAARRLFRVHKEDRHDQRQLWRILTRQSFAVLSHVTPDGEPRSSGVVYTVAGAAC
jgi:hypothetical protein